MEKENEVWKTYPEIEWVEASNLGKIRTKDRYVKHSRGGKRLVKGHIMKQHLKKNGYLNVSFGIGGKHVDRLAHRIIAACFIPNPDNLPEVNHKDCNRTNNCVSNLEWCDRSYNQRYREKYGVSNTEAQGHPLFAVSLKTDGVMRFRSQNEAARQLGISQGNIGSVLHGRQAQTNGFWFTENKDEITEEKLDKIRVNIWHTNMITVDLKTYEVLYFKSQSDAARQLGVNRGNINNVARGRYRQAGGYWFTNADSNAVEVIRAKFGDKVAAKVETLLKENQN